MFYKVAGKVGMYGLMVSLCGSLVHFQWCFYITRREANGFDTTVIICLLVYLYYY